MALNRSQAEGYRGLADGNDRLDPVLFKSDSWPQESCPDRFPCSYCRALGNSAAGTLYGVWFRVPQ